MFFLEKPKPSTQEVRAHVEREHTLSLHGEREREASATPAEPSPPAALLQGARQKNVPCWLVILTLLSSQVVADMALSHGSGELLSVPSLSWESEGQNDGFKLQFWVVYNVAIDI